MPIKKEIKILDSDSQEVRTLKEQANFFIFLINHMKESIKSDVKANGETENKYYTDTIDKYSKTLTTIMKTIKSLSDDEPKSDPKKELMDALKSYAAEE